MSKNKKNDSEGLREIYSESPREDLEAQKEESEEIYFNPEAGDPPKRREEPASVSNIPNLQKPPKKVFKKLVILVLLLSLLGVSFLIFKAYQNLKDAPISDSSHVNLEIIGPKEIISGELLEYKVILKNKSQLQVNNVEINARFPASFAPKEFNPLPKNDPSKNTNIRSQQYFWQFPKILPGAEEEIIIQGQIFGELSSKQIITISSHYQPENFSSDFKTSKSLETEIIDTLVSLEINAPKEIVDGAEVEYQIKISESKKSSSTSSPEGLKVFIEYPSDFTLKDVSPKPNQEEEQNFWLIDSLEAEKIITITGSLAGQSGEYKELLVQVGYYINDEFQIQAGESFITIIIKPELSLNLKINNLAVDSFSSNWTDEVSYSLTFANNGEIELSDIILGLNFSGDDILNWLSVDCQRKEDCDFLLTTSPDGSIKTLIWTRAKLPKLETLSPGQSDTINLRFNLKDSPPNGVGENPHATLKAEADYKTHGLKESLKVESNEVATKVKTKITLDAEARYYTDEYLKIGSGPLPPLVGAPTSFRIFWQLGPVSNNLKNIKVQTTLPENVSWTDKTQALAGQLEYNPFNRQVTWLIPNLKANESAKSRVNFEISATPTINQVGEYLTLTKETILDATDSFTGDSISAYSGYLTSELENDLAAQGKGRVE